jgi:lipopolysaccharide/colanic/teichoic acid biosynthesis glycosyltransferase
MQRLFDILFSAIAIAILLPLFIFVILILKVTGEGEAFFKQERIGYNNRTFFLLKFATMLKDSPHISTGTITVKDDPRVLPIGRVLRKTKINELPQLINVLIGDMSLVGPRPQTMRCFEAFPLAYQKQIVLVKPGLSGIGSIVFKSEEELMSNSLKAEQLYDELIMPYKGQLEAWFVINNNLTNYFKCILATMLVIIFSKSNIVWHVFPSLPEPPDDLKSYLSWAKNA